jgi:hypothetical protein
MKPLMDRIGDALQRKYEITAELRELADEFSNDVTCMENMCLSLQTRFERHTERQLDTKVVHLPKIDEDGTDFAIPSMFKKETGP